MRIITSLALAATLGCAGEQTDDTPAPTSEPQGGVTCPTGKCDGVVDDIKDYYDDMRGIDLDDLVGLGIGYADDALNSALSSVPYNSKGPKGQGSDPHT